MTTWFRNVRTPYRHIPSLAFVHIPIHAVAAMQGQYLIDVSTNPGQNGELIDHQGRDCDSDDKNCRYNGLDINFMKALVRTKNLMGVFSGHIHRVEYVLAFDLWTTC